MLFRNKTDPGEVNTEKLPLKTNPIIYFSPRYLYYIFFLWQRIHTVVNNSCYIWIQFPTRRYNKQISYHETLPCVFEFWSHLWPGFEKLRAFWVDLIVLCQSLGNYRHLWVYVPYVKGFRWHFSSGPAVHVSWMKHVSLRSFIWYKLYDG